jgi:hypothetical protein
MLAVNPVPWARSQMAFTLAVHIILVPLGVSWAFMTLIANYRGIKKNDADAMLLAQRWSKYMAVTFAVGAVTGTVLSFEFGLLWPRFMGQWGDVFGVPFAFEGVFFLAEAIFVSIYIFGWRRMKPWAHFWTGVPVVLTGILGSASVVQFLGGLHHAHALAAAARRRLHQHRIADFRRQFPGGFGVGERCGHPGHNGNAGGLHSATGLGLVPHGPDRTRRRPHKDEPRFLHRLREGRPLCQEAVAGVNGGGARTPGGVDQLVDAEVTLAGRGGPDVHRPVGGPHKRGGAVGVGIDRHRLESLFVAGADDPEGDFAAVGDEDPQRSGGRRTSDSAGGGGHGGESNVVP